jgi:hypothetical protein
VHQDHRSLEHIDHVSHARPGIKPFPDRLYVITAVSNPCRYRSRYELARGFQKYVADSGATLLTAEVSFGDRHFEITERDNPWHLQLTSNQQQELWLKEPVLNAALVRLSQLDPNWKYVAWIDADVFFSRTDWPQETLHSLQHHSIIQPWETAYHLDANDRIIETHKSFCHCYVNNVPEAQAPTYGQEAVKGTFWHPGFAWAARREFFTAVGGFFDVSVLGSSDHAMAKALVGRVHEAYHADVSEGFKRQAHIWQDRALRLKRNIGSISGSLFHRWHGSLQSRNYQPRWAYLTAGTESGIGAIAARDEHKFNPETDLIRDHQGLWQLHEDKITLRDGMRKYFRDRKEDLGF